MTSQADTLARPNGAASGAGRESVSTLDAGLWLPDSADPHRSVVAERHGRRDYLTRRLLAAADLVAVCAALATAMLISGRSEDGQQILFGALVLPVWLVVFKAYGLYDRETKRISHTAVDDVPGVAHAVLLGSLLTWVYYKVLVADQLVLTEMLILGLQTGVGVLLLRTVVRRASMRILGPERVVVLGEGPMSELLIRKIRMHPEYRLDPCVRISTRDVSGRGAPAAADLRSLDLRELAANEGIERILICSPGLETQDMLGLLRKAKEASLKVSVLPETFEAMGPSVEVDDVEGITLLGINPPVLPRSSRFLKRALDVVGAALALAAAAPLLALIAIAIKLGSRGPVLFRQRRVGKGDRRFEVLKFRSMVTDAEGQIESLLARSEDPNWLKLDRDPRVTRVGRMLRHGSLDELPQLWNVLKGDMSLVGPRPLIEREDRQVRGWARSRLDLTPGITGLWQVLGRTNIPFEEMVKLDYVYVTNWSLWGDIRLMLRTLPVVLRRRGAN